MSNYDDYLAQQRAAKAKRVETLNAVLKAGETLGYWKTLPDEYASVRDCEHMASHREVQTREGNRYSVSISDGRIVGRVAPLSTETRQRGIRMFPSDVHDAECTAKVDPARGAEVCARELHRRVIVPGAPIAATLREELAKRVAMRKALLKIVR